MMLDDVCRYARHILMASCKTSRFSFEKLIFSSLVEIARFVLTLVTFIGFPSTNSIVSKASMTSGVFSSIIQVWFSFEPTPPGNILGGQNLVSLYFSNPMFRWKLHLQVINGCSRFLPVKGGSPYDDIVGRKVVNYQEVKLLSCLKGERACCDHHCYYLLQVHLIPTETNEGRTQMDETSSSPPSAAERWKGK